MNQRWWSIVSAAACFWATACGDPPPGIDGSIDARDASEDDSGTPGVEVTLGTGQTDWEDVPRVGGELELVYGAQGGYHVWGRARFRGFAPDVDVGFIATDLATGRVVHEQTWARRRVENNVSYGLQPVGMGAYATDAELVVLAIQCSNEVFDHPLQVRAFVRERASGRIATDARTATVVDRTNPTACVMH